MGMREDLVDFVKYMRRTVTPWHTSKEIADMLIANDVVPVVRCKDCKKQGNDEECPLISMMSYTEPYDYCSLGERKDDD